jgi:hypothetical protein
MKDEATFNRDIRADYSKRERPQIEAALATQPNNFNDTMLSISK